MELVWKITPLFFLSISRMVNMRRVAMRVENTVIMMEIMMVMVVMMMMMTVMTEAEVGCAAF